MRCVNSIHNRHNYIHDSWQMEGDPTTLHTVLGKYRMPFKKGPVVTLASDTCRCPVLFSAYNSPGDPVIFCTWDVWVPWAATDSHHHSSSRDDVLLPPPVHMLVEMCSECNHIVEVWDVEDYTTHHMDASMLSTQHCQRVCLRYRIRYRTQTML